MEIDVSKLGLCNQPELKEDPIITIQRTYIGETCPSKDSILESIDTGTPIVIEKPTKPQFATPLFKEYFLSEFKSESEKREARFNLGVYSTTQVDEIISKIVGDNLSNYLTKEEVQDMVNNLDRVLSISKKNINYNIPERLWLQK